MMTPELERMAAAHRGDGYKPLPEETRDVLVALMDAITNVYHAHDALRGDLGTPGGAEALDRLSVAIGRARIHLAMTR